jgi:hypothetical protein
MQLFLPCLVLSGALLASGCGGGLAVGGSSSASSTAVSVAASPSNASVISGNTRQFTAVVSNSQNKAVTWSATAGSVTSSGLFTAPTVSAATQIRVTATSKADSTKSATVALTVNPTGSATAVLTVSPANLSFTAKVGASNLTPDSVVVSNGGSGTLTFTGVSDQSWLVLSAKSGTAPSTFQVTPSIAGLKAGTYIGHVTLTGGGTTKAVTVSLSMTTGTTAGTTNAPVEHSVSLAWRSSTDPKIISYSMYRSTIKGSSYGLLASSVGTVTYSDQSVQPATIYYYVVTAVDGTGQESPYSNEIRASVP